MREEKLKTLLLLSYIFKFLICVCYGVFEEQRTLYGIQVSLSWGSQELNPGCQA